ncbi:MAG: pilus assembly protein TadE [Sphingomonadales bacterium]|nr:pilus assembly protein TadE [Sphingomonadales bacterium]
MNASSLRQPARRVAALASRLGRDRSANSLIEFAYSLPLFLTLGMYGTELAYMATVNMQVSQMAMALADNASRLGQADNSAVTPKVYNTDIDSIMSGAMKQGAGINFQANGRLILSSLEKDTATGRQYIHWQKCRGSLTTQTSAYGPTGYGLTGATITGLGKTAIKANAGSAVMFVEAYYSYKPLFGAMFVKNVKFAQEAAFMIRDDRDLGTSADSGVPTTPAGNSEC